MKKIICGGDIDEQKIVGRKLALDKEETFVDLHCFIIENYLSGHSISSFTKKNGTKKFKRIEYKALKKVLNSKYDYISVAGGTIEFDKNKELIGRYDVLRIYLQESIKKQIGNILNEESISKKSKGKKGKNKKVKKRLEKKFENKDVKNKEYADIVVKKKEGNLKKVTKKVAEEVSFQEGVLPYREKIDNIDDELIARIKGTHIKKTEFSGESIGQWYGNKISIQKKINKIKSKFSGLGKGKIKVEWTKELVQLLWNRFTIVSQVAEYKRKIGKSALQKGRKAKVKAKWIEGLGKKGGEIYEYIHGKSVELETEIMEKNRIE